MQVVLKKGIDMFKGIHALLIQVNDVMTLQIERFVPDALIGV